MTSTRLVVDPPDENGWRAVRYDGAAIGVAHRPSDILVFLEATGLPHPQDLDLTTSDLVEWRQVGPESWAESPP
ncbi:hypothetical protein [Streptomyces sp. NBC_01565]|uniref:hypothetical protein n=1 Tax=unclassified Streptomyces TaxID=2593676 RepID=UPI0022554422|nr:hypothetical protein [Streptomyces sp. NBC_01565]MCX4545844.1 hypothetical protein [Streptomyces sp. NBC_01565]